MALVQFWRSALLNLLNPKPHFYAPSTNYSSDKKKGQCIESTKTTFEEAKSSPDDDEKSERSEELLPEPQLIQFDTPEDKHKRLLQKCRIVLREPDNYALISGVPLEITCTRPARIHQPTKNAQQQGTRHLGHWLIDFDTKERWENPLMGWCSSGDALSNVKMRFSTKAEAIEYCRKNNMTFWVQESRTRKKFKVRSYGINFSHNRRTRVSTK